MAEFHFNGWSRAHHRAAQMGEGSWESAEVQETIRSGWQEGRSREWGDYHWVVALATIPWSSKSLMDMIVTTVLGRFFEQQCERGCHVQTERGKRERERGMDVGRLCNQPTKKQCVPELGHWILGIFGNPKFQIDWKAGVGAQGNTPAST